MLAALVGAVPAQAQVAPEGDMPERCRTIATATLECCSYSDFAATGVPEAMAAELAKKEGTPAGTHASVCGSATWFDASPGFEACSPSSEEDGPGTCQPVSKERDAEEELGYDQKIWDAVRTRDSIHDYTVFRPQMSGLTADYTERGSYSSSGLESYIGAVSENKPLLNGEVFVLDGYEGDDGAQHQVRSCNDYVTKRWYDYVQFADAAKAKGNDYRGALDLMYGDRDTLAGIYGTTRSFSPADGGSERAPTPAQASRVPLDSFPRNAFLTLPDADTLSLLKKEHGDIYTHLMDLHKKTAGRDNASFDLPVEHGEEHSFEIQAHLILDNTMSNNYEDISRSEYDEYSQRVSVYEKKVIDLAELVHRKACIEAPHQFPCTSSGGGAAPRMPADVNQDLFDPIEDPDWGSRITINPDVATVLVGSPRLAYSLARDPLQRRAVTLQAAKATYVVSSPVFRSTVIPTAEAWNALWQTTIRSDLAATSGSAVEKWLARLFELEAQVKQQVQTLKLLKEVSPELAAAFLRTSSLDRISTRLLPLINDFAFKAMPPQLLASVSKAKPETLSLIEQKALASLPSGILETILSTGRVSSKRPRSSWIKFEPLLSTIEAVLESREEQIAHLTEAIEAQRGDVVKALVEEWQRGKQGCMAVFGAKPREFRPNVCDWSPALAVRRLTNLFSAEIEADRARCEKHTGDNFSSSGDIRNPDGILRNRYYPTSAKPAGFCESEKPVLGIGEAGTKQHVENVHRVADFISHMDNAPLWRGCEEEANRKALAMTAGWPVSEGAERGGKRVNTLGDRWSDGASYGVEGWASVSWDARAEWQILKDWEYTDGKEDPFQKALCGVEGFAVAELNADASIIKKPISIVKAKAGLSFDSKEGGQALGNRHSLVLKILGKDYIEPAADNVSHDQVKTWNYVKEVAERAESEKIGTTIPLFGIVNLSVEFGAVGTVGLGVNLGSTLAPVPLEGAKGQNYDDLCLGLEHESLVKVTPYAIGSLVGDVAVDVYVAKVGVEVELELLNLSLPVTTGLTITAGLDGRPGEALLKTDAAFVLSTLNGKIRGYAEIDYFFGTKRKSVDIFSWDGYSQTFPLFGIEAATTLPALAFRLGDNMTLN